MKTTEFAKKIFGKTNIKSIDNAVNCYEWKYKIVVFVPAENTDELAFRMASEGAGKIGNYSVCSFRSKGVGTFIGGSTSNPFAGKRGKFEMVEEVRLEMICEDRFLDNVIDSMYEVHPYEEPAYEIYPVMVRTKNSGSKIISVSFKKPVALRSILSKLNRLIDTSVLNGSGFGIKINNAVIDFSGKENIEPVKNAAKKILYITKISNSTYNIRLL